MNELQSYLTLLQTELHKRREKNARYSLRAFARSLKVDVAQLSRILNGKRLPTPAFAQRVFATLDLSANQRRAFRESQAKSYLQSPVRRKPRSIREHSRSSPPVEKELSPELFSVIGDWYHYAILQLLEVEGPQPDVAQIAWRLSIKTAQVESALRRLRELHMISWHNGQWKRTFDRLSTASPGLTAPAFRKRVRQVSEKSIESLERDPIEQRCHRTLTLAIDPAQIRAAKILIEEFMDCLSIHLSTQKKRVYELQVNLFPLDRGISYEP